MTDNMDKTLTSLTAISPIDGRYASKTAALRPYASEYGLIYFRITVEVAWFRALASDPGIVELPMLDDAANNTLDEILDKFDEAAAQRVKILEKTTNHDVKAVEYFLKEKIQGKR